MMLRWVAISVLVLGLSDEALASELEDAIAKGGVKLAGGDLSAIYGGHGWEGKTAKGGAFKTSFAADGAGELTFKGKTEPGKWRVEGDRGCTAWSGIRNGAEACVTILKVPDGGYAAFSEDGSLNSTFAVK